MTERWESLIEHDRTRPVVNSRIWNLTRNDRTLESSVRSLYSSVRSLSSGPSGHHLTIEIGRSTFEERGHVARIA